MSLGVSWTRSIHDAIHLLRDTLGNFKGTKRFNGFLYISSFFQNVRKISFLHIWKKEIVLYSDKASFVHVKFRFYTYETKRCFWKVTLCFFQARRTHVLKVIRTFLTVWMSKWNRQEYFNLSRKYESSSQMLICTFLPLMK